MTLPVLVIGGGAAGLIAAWRSALAGRETLLLEANPRMGVKVRISGGGKCNVTHAGPVKGLLSAFPQAQARFLRPAMHTFSNQDVVALLRREGVETWERADGRIFPLDRPGTAQRVVEALQGIAAKAGATLVPGTRVEGLMAEAGRILGIRAGGTRIEAAKVILATGGASYPRTGTRGEALAWLRELGLPVKPWFPALAPIPLVEPRSAWEGVALRDGELRLRPRPDGPVLARFTGDILYTRAGISGPAALDLSERVESARRAGGAILEYALHKDPVELQHDFLEVGRNHPDASLRRWLCDWLPDRIAVGMVEAWGLPADARLRRLTREDRRKAVDAIIGFPLGAAGPVPLEQGEVCAGGLELRAVEPRTMAVRGWENLHVCGELLDVNGPVGGYNLQAAFSTGFLAGTDG